MKIIRTFLALLLCAALCTGLIPPAMAEDADSVYRVDLSSTGVELSPHLYGIFLEDINYAVDGGLYAELVQNRSFEFFPMATNGKDRNAYTYAWSLVGGAEWKVNARNGMNDKNRHWLRVTAKAPGDGVANKGYDGIVVTEGEEYRVSLYMRGSYAGEFRVQLISRTEVLAETILTAVPSDGWTKLTGYMTAASSVANARLEVTLTQPGEVDLDMISLFPVHTWNNRENGLRADLVQILKDLQPGFLRFPGGCIVEGEGLDNAYNWKDSVGDVSERATIFNRWRRNGDSGYYYQSYGLGFYEFFLLCEDLGCEPIPCLNAGISCYGPEYVQMKDLQPYIDDALDLIAFATGDPATNEWAALRAEMGHPEPFQLTYLEIGNEQGGDARYYERFAEFERQIHAVYPDIKLISSVIGLSNGAGLPTTEWLRGKGRDFVYANDEHFYMSGDWFLTNANRYDAMERGNDAFIFAGEYACHYSTANPHWNAVCEAAFMTGFERNGDVVKLTCYAPLLSKLRYTQWQPNLIIFNNSGVYGTPSYWVNYLYSTNLGDHTLAESLTLPAESDPVVSGKVGVASWNTRVEYDDLRVIDTETGTVLFQTSFDDTDLSVWTDGGGQWKVSGGVISQRSATSIDNALHIGDTSWKNYTITLRARKTHGAEGFIIPFLVQDRLNYYHLNLGGWNNTYSAIERAVDGAKSLAGTSNFTVETGVWYDIRIEVDQTAMRCYVDDELIIASPFPQQQDVYATASVDEETGDVILKLVNVTGGDHVMQIDLDNPAGLYLNPTAEMHVLTRSGRGAINTMATKEENAPVVTAFTGVSEHFTITLPQLSMTVLRIHTRPDSEVLSEKARVTLETTAGVAPRLPDTAPVTFRDGSTGTKPVVWSHVESTLFDHPGVYEIEGNIDGRPLAVAVVTVTEAP